MFKKREILSAGVVGRRLRVLGEAEPRHVKTVLKRVERKYRNKAVLFHAKFHDKSLVTAKAKDFLYF